MISSRKARRTFCSLAQSVCIFAGFMAHASAQTTTTDTLDASSHIDELRSAVSTAGTARIGQARIELAEAILAQLAGEGLDLTLLFGVPSAEDIARVEQAARQAGALESARDQLEAAAAAIQRQPDYAESPKSQQRVSELLVDLGERRLPLVRARSAILLASSVADATMAQEHARQAIVFVGEMPPFDDRTDAQRLLIVGAALLILSDPDRARAAFEQARTNANSAGASRLLLESSIGLSLALGRTQDAEAGVRLLEQALDAPQTATLTAADGVIARLAATDALFQLTIERAAGLSSEAGRRRVVAEAFARYEQLLTDERIAGDYAARRALVLDKVASIHLDTESTQTPPILALAHARASETSAAIKMLDALLARTDEDLGPVAPDIRWERARILLRSAQSPGALSPLQDQLDAATLLADLADLGPGHPFAVDAIRAACSLTAAAGETAGAVRLRALRVGTSRFAHLPEVDVWRLQLADLLDAAEPEAEAALTAIGPGSEHAAAAQARLVQRARERLMRSSGEQREELAVELLERARTAQVSVTTIDMRTLAADAEVAALTELGQIEEAARVLARAAEWAKGGEGREIRSSRALTSALRENVVRALAEDGGGKHGSLAPVFLQTATIDARLASGADAPKARKIASLTDLALALTLAGDGCRAVELYDELIAQQGRVREHLLWRGEALLACGEDEEAFSQFRDLAGALEASGDRSAAYWACWSRMLELLAKRNDDGERTEMILREVRRLRFLDESLGGSPYQARIERVERELK